MQRYILYDPTTEEWGWDEEMTPEQASAKNLAMYRAGNNSRWILYEHYAGALAL